MPSSSNDIASIREQIKENASFLYPRGKHSLLLLYREQDEGPKGYQAILNCERLYGNDITAHSDCETSPRKAWKGLLRALGKEVFRHLSKESELEGNAGMMLEGGQTEYATRREDWFDGDQVSET